MFALLRKMLNPKLRHSWQYFMHPVYGRVRYDHITHRWERATIHGTWLRWAKPRMRYNSSLRRWEFTTP